MESSFGNLYGGPPMVRKWKVFTRSSGFQDTQVPRVTIQKDGNLGINRAAMELIGTPEKIVYLRDEQSRSFGIAGAPEGVLNSYPARAQANGSSYVASAKLFLQWADVPFGNKPRFFVPRLEDDVLVIDFDDENPDEKIHQQNKFEEKPKPSVNRSQKTSSWR